MTAPATRADDLGVSFVVPVYNGAATLEAALGAILAEADGRPLEVLVIDDGSTDGSGAIIRRHAAGGRVRLIPGARRGATAALNVGLRAARHPVICQVDQDVILEPGWLRHLTAALAANPDAAAAQGYYLPAPDAGVWARVMGLDLMHRYASIRTPDVDHVCTGNTAYRREALGRVGGFDEALGYGYDNDLSYRLGQAGYRLLFCPAARSIHRWRTSLPRYLRQQYGFGYGRLDLIAKHPTRVSGDRVSSLTMILHAPGMLLALLALLLAGALAPFGLRWEPAALTGGALLGLLAVERAAAGLSAARRFGDATALLFPLVHLLRDVSWAWASVVWLARRLARRAGGSTDSMWR